MHSPSLSSIALAALAYTSTARETFATPERAREGTYLNSGKVDSIYNSHRQRKGTPLEMATAHLKSQAPDAEFKINGDEYTDADTGISHYYFTQWYNGLKIENAVANVNFKKDGTILSSGSSLFTGRIDPDKIEKRADIIDPLDALKGAAKAQGYKINAEKATAIRENSLTDETNSYTFIDVEGVQDKPKANLVYYATPEGVKLTWRLETDLDNNYMITYVDAKAAYKVVSAHDWISDAMYNVYPTGGAIDPSVGERQLITDPVNLKASPNGWHDVGGWKYTTTWGNNVIAHKNFKDGPDWTNNFRPDGGKNLTFDYPYSRNMTDPNSYTSAAVTQLFYTCNVYHDFLEVLGFTEAAGNFEEVNTGPGGIGGDGVIANTQDGPDTDNAFMYTPPDGTRPRMRMLVFSGGRDSAFDQAVIIHEYTHGLSNRLTGGPRNSDCLTTIEARGLGEGWGDWFATAMFLKPTDTRKTDCVMGPWVVNNPKGIRKYPYSTSMTTNPFTYVDVNDSFALHFIGTIWATMLYEVLWNLEEKHGYQTELFPVFRYGTAIPTKGRQLAMKIVLEGMKLQPCNPDFLAARDAILDADKVITGGENQCEIWTGFAKRGLGADAVVRRLRSRTVRTNGFRLPRHLRCDTRPKVRFNRS